MGRTTVQAGVTIESPRLRQLAGDLAGDTGTAALAAFWQECEDRGGPLIEEHDPASQMALVTFLWREQVPLQNVVLVEWITQGDFPDKQMEKLPGSDTWFRSLRVRDDIRTTYQFSPNDSLVKKRDETDWPTRQANWVNDPLNPVRLVDERYLDDPDLVRYNSSILSMPAASPQPWLESRPGVPVGTVTAHRFESDLLGNIRDIWVYTPAGYGTSPGTLPLLVLFDGERHETVMRTPQVLDNLIANGAIPPVVAVMIGNVDRGLELPCYPPFARALATELVPWLADRYRISGDPARRVLAGQSYGGLAASFAALVHPDVFGNVISQSGSFWWKPDSMNKDVPRRLGDAPEYCWLPSFVATRSAVPVRFWMEVGRLEDRTFQDGIPGMITVNRYFRDVLVARGFDVTYREFGGGHDYACWRHNLADGLIALLGERQDD